MVSTAATIAQVTPSGQWRVHSELVAEDMGAVRFAEVLGRVMHDTYRGFTFARITGDPAGDIRAQTDETTPFQILRASSVSLRSLRRPTTSSSGARPWQVP